MTTTNEGSTAGTSGSADDFADPLTGALWAVRRGWHVFPLDHPSLPVCAGLHADRTPEDCADERGKHPCVAFSRQTISDEEGVFAEWAGASRNVAIACGPSGLIVIDEDRPGAFEEFCQEKGFPVPRTLRVRTARAYHYYFTRPPGFEHKNKAGELRQWDIDVRGTNGYVVAPGSLHQAGTIYAPVDADGGVLQLPRFLQDAIRKEKERPTPSPSVPGQRSGDVDVNGLLALLPEKIKGPPPDGRGHGDRHDVLISFAGTLRNRGVPLEIAEAIFRMAHLRCEQPPACRSELTWKDALGKLHDAYQRWPEGEPLPDLSDLPTLVMPEGSKAGGEDADEAADRAVEAALLFERKVTERVFELRVASEARIRVSAVDRPPIPTPMSLTNLLTLPDVDESFRIQGLLPSDGIVLFSAPQKGGKTTCIGNLVRSLADGSRFLGSFDVTQPVERMTLIDTESGDTRLKDWLRDQQVANTDAVTTFSLRGVEASLDVRDLDVRREWASLLRGSEVVVLDVAGPVIAALGMDENNNAEVGSFWVAFRAMLHEAGVKEGIVVHHTGHNESRAIGASAWLRYPDAIWQLHRESDDPTSPRYFSAYGRDVEVRQGQLLYDALTRRLTYTGKGKTTAQASRLVGLLVDWLFAHGPANTSACVNYLVDECDVKRDLARAVPKEGVRERVIRIADDGGSKRGGAVLYEAVPAAELEARGARGRDLGLDPESGSIGPGEAA